MMIAPVQPLKEEINNYISHYHADRPIEWARQFDRNGPLDVEIGFGLGEFLMRSARMHRDRNFIGIEKDWKRLKKALRKIEHINKYSSGNEKKVDNLRILQVDAVVAFTRLFKPGTIDRIFCLFPCPWPKKSHIKHRLFSRDFFKLINSRLKERGEVQIVTDYDPYLQWMLAQVKNTGFHIETKTIKPQFDTKFERKWCLEGQREFFELHLIKQEHCHVPVEEDVQLKVYFVKEFFPEKFKLNNIVGETSIVLKEFLYDHHRQKAMVHVVVAEKIMTQHVWITIEQCSRGWCVAKTEGHTVLPTKGVAKAIQTVYNEVLRTNNAEPSLIV